MKENKSTSPSLLADASIFLYFKEKTGERKTKVEAYCNLLDKASKGFVSKFLQHNDYQLKPNQCHVTITDLAAEWQWHRATVRSFMEKIESFGLIRKEVLPKSIVITIPDEIEQNPDTNIVQSENSTILSLLPDLSKWINGQRTLDDIGQDCFSEIESKLKDFADKQRIEEENRLVTHMVEAAVAKLLYTYRFNDGKPLLRFWKEELGGSLDMFLPFCFAMAKYIFDGESSTLKDDFCLLSGDLAALSSSFKGFLASTNDNRL